MFFFNRRKKYNGSVSALLPAFGIDLEEAGAMKTLNVLDIAWQNKYSQYEGALLVAYSFAGGLYNIDTERAEEFTEKMMPIQADWVKKDLVRESLVEKWPGVLLKRAQQHTQPEPEFPDEPYPFTPNMPDVTKRDSELMFKAGNYVIIFVKDPPTISEGALGQSLPMNYPYVMVAINNNIGMPQYFVTLEGGITGSFFLCIFDRQGNHQNLGSGSDYLDENMFVVKALELMKQEFGFEHIEEMPLSSI